MSVLLLNINVAMAMEYMFTMQGHEKFVSHNDDFLHFLIWWFDVPDLTAAWINRPHF